MKHLSLILGIILFSLSIHSYAYEERNLLQQKLSLYDLSSVVQFNQEWVKFPAYSDRTGWDKLLGDNKQNLIKEGDKYLKYEWRVVKATDYLGFARTGNRTDMEIPYDANLKAINNLFLAEMASGEGRYLDQLVNGIFHTCEMTSWSLSAHVGIQKAKGPLPDHRQQIIDLVAGDVGAAFSWIYYFLNKEFDKINPLISKRIYDEIESRIFEPYLDKANLWWMGFNVTKEKGMVNNWNTWCNANVLQAYLLIDKDKERVKQAITKSILSVDKFLNYTKSDGACEEGPAYWGHAAGKLCDYLQLLSDATGGKISIFEEPSIKKMGEYISRSYVSGDWVVNFADAAARMRPDSRLVYRYGKLIESNEMMQFAAFLKRDNRISVNRDLYRILYGLNTDIEMAGKTGEHTLPAYTWYPETEFCYMTNKDIFFAAKGGFNEESHNHNDVGTFSLYVKGMPIFIDAGVGTYTRQTFSHERYNIWTMQSDYHNLPIINGASQQFGRNFKAENSQFDSKKKTFSLNMAKAYPSEAGIKDWTRAYRLNDNALEIEDKYDITTPKQPNVINFLTWGNIDTSEKGVIRIDIQGNETKLVYDSKTFSASVEAIEITDKRLTNVWGDKVQRISLKAQNLNKRGKYNYKIVF